MYKKFFLRFFLAFILIAQRTRAKLSARIVSCLCSYGIFAHYTRGWGTREKSRPNVFRLIYFHNRAKAASAVDVGPPCVFVHSDKHTNARIRRNRRVHCAVCGSDRSVTGSLKGLPTLATSPVHCEKRGQIMNTIRTWTRDVDV